MRRAWIEIRKEGLRWQKCLVALHAESVDRNWASAVGDYICPLSLSMRRAWIEIVMGRNLGKNGLRRSPCGERG